MNIQIFFTTWLRGKLMGIDAHGNRYYQDRWVKRYGRFRRWVIYKNTAEASQVPSQWHAWLHHNTEEPPTLQRPYSWEKPHLPNLTGTPLAHRFRRTKRHLASDRSDVYEPWTPPRS